MKKRIQTTDNNSGLHIDEDGKNVLLPFSERPLTKLLSDYPDLILFPEITDDQEYSAIFTISGNDLYTNNIAGFLDVDNISLRINSRFSDFNYQDYFLHYMLQRIFLGYVVNFDIDSDCESIMDYLMYLFPCFLKRAVAQGVYREYQNRKFNDDKVKGWIDINRHIRMNHPFRGNIAYSTRELSEDNYVTQLIRHTISYLQSNNIGNVLLRMDDQVIAAINDIVRATPSYDRSRRVEILSRNLKPVRHPYYTMYTQLQKLCIAILNQEKLNNGYDDTEVKGLIFDCSWLWEEYIATLISPLMVHSMNRRGVEGIHVFNNKALVWYPDFYKDNICVLDAKYKKLRTFPSREDLQQIISYMHLLHSKCGGFISPSMENRGISIIGNLRGSDAPVMILRLGIPYECDSFKDFCNRISREEIDFITNVERLLTT